MRRRRDEHEQAGRRLRVRVGRALAPDRDLAFDIILPPGVDIAGAPGPSPGVPAFVITITPASMEGRGASSESATEQSDTSRKRRVDDIVVDLVAKIISAPDFCVSLANARAQWDALTLALNAPDGRVTPEAFNTLPHVVRKDRDDPSDPQPLAQAVARFNRRVGKAAGRRMLLLVSTRDGTNAFTLAGSQDVGHKHVGADGPSGVR